MDEEERKKLPRWARERLEVEEDMGTLETSASPGTVVLGNEEEETRLQALDAARRAVQFLESGQATGCFILLTNSDRAIMWDRNLTPDPHPIGDAANVLGEMSNRLRTAWYRLISDDDDGRGFLQAVDDDSDEP